VVWFVFPVDKESGKNFNVYVRFFCSFLFFKKQKNHLTTMMAYKGEILGLIRLVAACILVFREVESNGLVNHLGN